MSNKDPQIRTATRMPIPVYGTSGRVSPRLWIGIGKGPLLRHLNPGAEAVRESLGRLDIRCHILPFVVSAHGDLRAVRKELTAAAEDFSERGLTSTGRASPIRNRS